MRCTDRKSLLTLVIILAVILVFGVGGYLLIGSRRVVTPAAADATMPAPGPRTE